jgi:histidinol-phosphate aminotransferase
MSVVIREELREVADYQPGRKPADVTVTAGAGEAADLVKLSSNELAFEPLPAAREAMRAAVDEANRYPDFFARGLVTALSGHLGVGEDQLAVDNGSAALCLSAVAAVTAPGDSVVLPWRSFPVYERAARHRGAEPVRVPLSDGVHHDLAAMTEAITEHTKVVFLCNPNNPTGAGIDATELRAFIDRVPRSVLVVVDEAYQDFVTNPAQRPHAVPLAAERENVVVLRTFSKAFGLAGLRIGYAVGPPQVTGALRRLSTPFAVSGPAQAAAVASLGAFSEIEARVAEVTAERARLLAALRSRGMVVADSDANFVWLPLGQQSQQFAASCERAGVLVRPFHPDGVRVTIGSSSDDDKFLGAVDQWLDTGGHAGSGQGRPTFPASATRGSS